TLTFRDIGSYPGEGGNHSYTAIVGSDRAPQGAGVIGPGHYGPFGSGRVCPGDLKDPMPSQCDDGPFGKGTGGRLRYLVNLPAGGSKTICVSVAGSEEGLGDARSELQKALDDPAGQLERKIAAREKLDAYTK